ncbi:MAG TPA: glycosyltransferase [Pseudonocardia sp.]|nr:glycosyltransferase [Pseudonocardia sp.]
MSIAPPPACAGDARARSAGRSRPIGLTFVTNYVGVGGAETWLLNLFRHLDPAVVRPRVICFKEPGPLGAEFAEAGIPVDVLGRGGRHDPSTPWRLWRSLRASGTDVVLVHHLHEAPLFISRLVARATGRRSIVSPHGMDTVPVAGRRCLPRHDVATLFLSDAILWLAPSQARYFREHEGVGRHWWSRTREVIVPNGIPMPPAPDAAARAAARSALGLADDDVAVGVLARLAPVKAHEVLLEALAGLAPMRPRLRLVCIGGGEREQELRMRAAELGVAGRVRWLGLRRDVPRLLPGLDVGALSSRFECAPLSLVELMAAAVPVVSTDVGCVRDLVGDGLDGFVVPPGDPAALEAALAKLVDDPDLRASMGATARERVARRFRIENTAAAVQELLTGLVRRRR